MLPLVSLLLMLEPAASVGLEIHWRGDPACVATERVAPRVAALMGEAAAPRATLELAATREGEDWRISLWIRSATQSFDRTLVGRDCDTLTEAVALIVAVQLDPIAVADTMGSQTAADGGPTPAEVTTTTAVPLVPLPPEPEPELELEPSSPVDLHPRASPRPRLRAPLQAAVMAELGVLPRGAAAFELATGIAWPRARVELGALASVGPDATAPGQPSVGGRFGLFTGSIRGCGLAGRGRFELPLCGGLELGDLRATGTGLRQPATVDALWLAAVGSARLQWVPRPRLAVGARLDLVAPLRRHRFATPETGLVHQIDPIAARLGLLVELRLP